MGIGNRLMMDDGIGPALIEALQDQPTEEATEADKVQVFRYVIGETDVHYCMEQFREGEPFLLLDATHFGVAPGTVTLIPFAELLDKGREAPFGQAYFSGHEETVVGKLIRKEGACQPDFRHSFLLGIEVFTVDYGIGLSPPLQEQFAQILSAVKHLLNDDNNLLPMIDDHTRS